MRQIEESVPAFLDYMRSVAEDGKQMQCKSKDMLVAAARGESDAIGQFYQCYNRELMKIAHSRMPHAADDLVALVYERMVEGKFKNIADKIESGAQKPEAFLSIIATTVLNEVRQQARREMKAKHAVKGRSEAPKASKMSRADRGVVDGAVKRAISRLSTAAGAFIKDLIYDEVGNLRMDSLLKIRTKGQTDPVVKVFKQVALKHWPDKKPNNAEREGNKARTMFLKHLCKDVAIRDLLPGGRGRSAGSSFFGAKFEPICVEAEGMEDVYEFALAAGLIEDTNVNPSVLEDLVLNWLIGVVSED